MVDTFNDDDQAQQLKDWWKQNWQPVLLGLGISVGGVMGYNAWQSHNHAQAELASGHYEQLRQSLASGNLEAATEARQTLADEYSGSPYAAQAALALAQHYVQADDLITAGAQLQWVVDNAGDDKLVQIARLRLARVKWASGANEEALQLLNTDDSGAFASLFAELRGDILLSQGEMSAARDAYQAAMDAAMQSDAAASAAISRPTLQRKLDDLAAATDEPTAEASAGDS